VPETGPSNAEAAARLRRSKIRATSLLLVAAVGYALTFLADTDHGWVGYARAAAEAGMVGGLADWFAVVALFRHPLGLPIPHTALIPSKKRELGTSLGSFVTENFLEEELIRSKIASAHLSERLGTWLRDPAHLELAVDRAVAAAVHVVDSIEADDVHAITPVVQGTLAELPYARFLGEAIHNALESGQHRPIVDLIIARSHAWLHDNESTVVETIVDKAPWFLPRKATAKRLFRAAVELSAELAHDPAHPLRESFDQTLRQLGTDLQQSASTQAKVDDLVRRSVARPEVTALLDDTLRAGLETLRESLRSGPLAGQLRHRLHDVVQRLAEDESLRSDITSWVEEQALRAVVANRHEVVAFIGDTVDRWDADEAARRIELQVGPDLQAIRINGTAVGALAGLLIHLVTELAQRG
jgi:uncharacterized membrane-anchored protein YjiN (DUF445 family)